MSDYSWPSALYPSGSSFWLQPHTGGSQSPFTRTTKLYGLAGPLWQCSLSFRAPRGMRWGDVRNASARKLDALLARLEGRLNRVAVYDFDYPAPIGALAAAAGNVAAARGAFSMTITGMVPGATVLEGSYIGGDGRPHLVAADAIVAGDGTAVVSFRPPLLADVGANTATFERVTGLFRQTGDEAAQNFNPTGDAADYSIQFIEDFSPSVDVTFGSDVVTYSG